MHLFKVNSKYKKINKIGVVYKYNIYFYVIQRPKNPALISISPISIIKYTHLFLDSLNAVIFLVLQSVVNTKIDFVCLNLFTD